MKSHEFSGSTNTSTTMMEIDEKTIEMIDLSTDTSNGGPKMGDLVANPYLQKASTPRTIRNPDGSLVDVFIGDDYGKPATAVGAFPSTVQGPGGLGGSSRNMSKLDYFFDAEDDVSNSPKVQNKKGQSQINGMNDHVEDANTHSGITPAGPKRRKISGRLSRPPGLFMTPAPERSKIHKRASRKPFDALRTVASYASPSFDLEARNTNQTIPRSTAQQTQPQPQPRISARPQLHPKTGIDNVDITNSLNYVERQIERTSNEVIQPVIELTKMVKELQSENSSLWEQLRRFQAAVKKSVAEIHERQDEHEDLIDRLSSSTINPAGTPYGGPRNTAVKKPSLFRGTLSGHGTGAGGPNAASR